MACNKSQRQFIHFDKMEIAALQSSLPVCCVRIKRARKTTYSKNIPFEYASRRRRRHIQQYRLFVGTLTPFVRSFVVACLRACCHFATHMLIVFQNLIPKTPLDVNYRQLNEINWCYFSFHTHTDTHTHTHTHCSRVCL